MAMAMTVVSVSSSVVEGMRCMIAIDISIGPQVFEDLGAAEASNEGAEKGKEYDSLIHGFRVSPS
jgi:hypothetical protein